MRIFVAVRHSVDQKFYYGGLWSGNFYPALRQLGNEVIESKVDLLPASRFMHVNAGFTAQEHELRGQITEQILKELKRAHVEQPIDLFLSYFYNAHFDPAGFAEIRNLGIPTVNFYCNSIYQFDLVAAIASAVDFSWHAEKDAPPLYQNVKANPVWIQMGADPQIYRPVKNSSRRLAACFVGQRYADRDRWMATLVRANVPLVAYGPGWRSNGVGNRNGETREAKPTDYLGRRIIQPNSLSSYFQAFMQNLNRHGLPQGVARSWRQNKYRRESCRLSPILHGSARDPIPFDQISQVFSEHEVVLNFSNVWSDGRPGSTLIPHVRLRDFEAPMSRTCYLTGHTDEITEFYEPGKEIETYKSPEELVDKTNYYLSHPEQAERLREAGYRRAIRDHTWVERFKRLFSLVGLKNGKHSV